MNNAGLSDYELSICYSQGKDNYPKDYAKSLYYAKSAMDANPGNDSLLLNYANILQLNGTDTDKKCAFDIIKTMAEKENDLAMIFLANMYYYGIGTEINYEKSNYWRRRSAISINSMPVNTTFIINPDIYKKEKIVLLGDTLSLLQLSALCLQFNLKPDYICNLDCNYDLLTGFSPNICIDSALTEDCLTVLCDCATIAYLNNEKNLLGRSYVMDDCSPLLRDNYPELLVINDHINKNDAIILGNHIESWVKRVYLDRWGVMVHDIYSVSSELDFNVINSITSPDTSIIIYSEKWAQYRDELARYGFNDNNIFVDLAYLENKQLMYVRNNGITENKLPIIEMFKSFQKGKRLWDRLSHSTKGKYVIGDWTAVGDTFKTVALLSPYKHNNNLETVILVTIEKYKGIYKFFKNIDGELILSDDEMNDLRRYCWISMQYDSGNVSFFGKRAFCGLTMSTRSYSETYSYFNGIKELLGLPITENYSLINPGKRNKKSKKVLLIPYGYWIFSTYPESQSLIMEIFEKIAFELASDGFEVYTNCSSNQIPLKYSKGYSESILDLVSHCTQFSCIISVTTGLAEALALANCNMHIIHYNSDTLYRIDYRDLNDTGRIKIHVARDNPNLIKDIIRSVKGDD